MSLQPAKMETARAKIGLYGPAGAGKTRTAMEIAIGLAHETGAPIAFFDTEGGSDFFVKRCQAEGIELLTEKTRTFMALIGFMQESEKLGAIQVIDSITSVWDDLRLSYERRMKRTKGLEIWDWGIIKPEWARFNTAFLTMPVHSIVCGKQGDIYERVYNESKDKWEVEVTGSKMRTEKETAYEPSLLVRMWREPRRDESGKAFWHTAVVEKDRSDTMDGEEIRNPRYSSFLPFLEALDITGEHRPTDATQDSQGLFKDPNSAYNLKRRRDAVMEKIEDAFLFAKLSKRRDDDKRVIKEHLEAVFGTTAESEWAEFSVERLEEGLDSIRSRLLADYQPEDGDPAQVIAEA